MSVPHKEEAFAEANGLRLCYDTFGDPNDPPILLVMGLGAQMIVWDEFVCNELAEAGYWVIRYDNRDVGKSTRLDELGMPDLMAALSGQGGDPPYLLRDLADDAAGLLDALGIDKAHVIGASMGGMIVQELLIHHADRLKTAVSIMSTTGHPDLPQAKPEALQVLLQPAPINNRDKYIEYSVQGSVIIGSTGFELDMEGLRRRAGLGFDRGLSPQGTARQMAAILASGSRRAALHNVTTPTLVIHGSADPLVPVEGGIDTAESIPNAKLLVIEGMGHDIPKGAWPQVKEAILAHIQDG